MPFFWSPKFSAKLFKKTHNVGLSGPDRPSLLDERPAGGRNVRDNDSALDAGDRALPQNPQLHSGQSSIKFKYF
jgi:hypothetical protein